MPKDLRIPAIDRRLGPEDATTTAAGERRSIASSQPRPHGAVIKIGTYERHIVLRQSRLAAADLLFLGATVFVDNFVSVGRDRFQLRQGLQHVGPDRSRPTGTSRSPRCSTPSPEKADNRASPGRERNRSASTDQRSAVLLVHVRSPLLVGRAVGGAVLPLQGRGRRGGAGPHPRLEGHPQEHVQAVALKTMERGMSPLPLFGSRFASA